MDNEWYEIHYIDCNRKIILEGSRNDVYLELELSEEQKERLYDFNSIQEQERKTFYRGILNEV